MKTNYDAILLVSFGGPEKMEDVVPFLANVTAGKNIPADRINTVAEHYRLFGGVSPINSYCRTLISSLRAELLAAELDIPIFWGNRNWHPLLPDTVREMTARGVRRALAFVTAAYSSYSSCRQYLENIESAQQTVSREQECCGTTDGGSGEAEHNDGKDNNVPEIHNIGPYCGHPMFIEVNAEHLSAALEEVPLSRRRNARVLFTAHSIPLTMAQNCAYENQLRQTCRLVAERAGISENWELVFQSRSGSPAQPWLAPDINDYIRELNQGAVQDLVVIPAGFICDHMEVVYSLDVEAAQLAHSRGINFVRAATAGTNRKFVHMVRDLILERMFGDADIEKIKTTCPAGCCPQGVPVRSLEKPLPVFVN